MAKKKLPETDKQINFRAPARLFGELNDIATALGLDVSNLVRLVLNENIAKYRARVERIRAGHTDELN